MFRDRNADLRAALAAAEPLLPGTPSGWYPDPLNEKTARYWHGEWTANARNDVPAKPVPDAAAIEAMQDRLAAQKAPPPWEAVLVTTSHDIPQRRLVEHCGEVFGATVRSRNFFSDWGAGAKGLVGGEIRGYTKLLMDARREALSRMREEAHTVGADAVVSMRVTANQISDLMTEIVAYGAAVKTEPEPFQPGA